MYNQKLKKTDQRSFMKESSSLSSWSLLGGVTFLAAPPRPPPRPPRFPPRPARPAPCPARPAPCPARPAPCPAPPRPRPPLPLAPPLGGPRDAARFLCLFPPRTAPPPPPPRFMTRPLPTRLGPTLADLGRAPSFIRVLASEAISIFMGRPSSGTPSYCFKALIASDLRSYTTSAVPRDRPEMS